jgi:hypothetical protein
VYRLKTNSADWNAPAVLTPIQVLFSEAKLNVQEHQNSLQL